MNNVSKSIGWANFTINPVRGLCPVDCKDNQGKSYCYARKMYKRFKWNPEIRFEGPVNISAELLRIRKPSRIFVGSTMELFGEWVDAHWMDVILEATKVHSQHTFLFLTKCPQNLKRFSPFPANCLVGVSVTNPEQFKQAHLELIRISATVKFLSFEPLLEQIITPDPRWPLTTYLGECASWIICGQQTPMSASTSPRIEWVREIVEAADKASIPVFLKNNLHEFLYADDIFWANERATLRQEMPG